VGNLSYKDGRYVYSKCGKMCVYLFLYIMARISNNPILSSSYTRIWKAFFYIGFVVLVCVGRVETVLDNLVFIGLLKINQESQVQRLLDMGSYMFSISLLVTCSSRV
jgi:hypothetical protein